MRKNLISNKVEQTKLGAGKSNCGVFIHMIRGMSKIVYQLRVNLKVIQNSMVLLEDDALSQREANISQTDGKTVAVLNERVNLSVEDNYNLSALVEVSCNTISSKDFRKLGWSLVRLSNYKGRTDERNYKLPVLEYPVNYNLYLSQGRHPRVVPETFVFLRVFEQEPNDDMEYIEPKYEKEDNYLNEEDNRTKYGNLLEKRGAKQPLKSSNVAARTSQPMKHTAENFKKGDIQQKGYVITLVKMATNENPRDLLLDVTLYAEEDIVFDENN